jgi:Outer membrane protein and related peptidoglycan-associated (lipo)proteins
MSKGTQGALAGGALGAGAGAIIGDATGHAGAGTAIGAGLGALGGALMGNALDSADVQNEALQGEIDRNQALIDENRRLIAELRRRGADVRDSERGIVISLPDVLFRFDDYRLTRSALGTIDEICDVLSGVSHRRISIEGHTDSVGSISYNRELSRQRAQSVKNAMEDRGIRGMRARGFGELSPVATNNSPEGRARNRRVEVIVENPAGERSSYDLSPASRRRRPGRGGRRY